jgi:hypothetical protein
LKYILLVFAAGNFTIQFLISFLSSFFVTREEFEEADENQDLKIAELPLVVF